MRRNIKVIEINGFRGFFVTIYAIICAFAGFILFPAFALMSIWNYIGTHIYTLPAMNFLHGFMFYVMLVLIYFATKQHKSCIGISSADMTESRIAAIMKDIDDDK